MYPSSCTRVLIQPSSSPADTTLDARQRKREQNRLHKQRSRAAREATSKFILWLNRGYGGGSSGSGRCQPALVYPFKGHARGVTQTPVTVAVETVNENPMEFPDEAVTDVYLTERKFKYIRETTRVVCNHLGPDYKPGVGETVEHRGTLAVVVQDVVGFCQKFKHKFDVAPPTSGEELHRLMEGWERAVRRVYKDNNHPISAQAGDGTRAGAAKDTGHVSTVGLEQSREDDCAEVGRSVAPYRPKRGATAEEQQAAYRAASAACKFMSAIARLMFGDDFLESMRAALPSGTFDETFDGGIPEDCPCPTLSFGLANACPAHRDNRVKVPGSLCAADQRPGYDGGTLFFCDYGIAIPRHKNGTMVFFCPSVPHGTTLFTFRGRPCSTSSSVSATWYADGRVRSVLRNALAPHAGKRKGTRASGRTAAKKAKQQVSDAA